MGRLLEVFEILCADYDHMLEKGGILFKGGHYIRKDIIQGNTVSRYSMGIAESRKADLFGY